MSVCPTDSISFSFGRRSRPPQGHFDKKVAEGSASLSGQD